MSGYLTTNENGEFTGTITGLTAGQKIISATFEGDDEYNRSNINKHITILDPTIELSLTSPSEVIEIGDTTTITATLTRNSLPFVNQEITYEIKHGSTIIDSDSDFTNNAGQITISYTGTGAGDITITASFNTSLQETYKIEDCYKYDTTAHNTNAPLNYTLPSEFELQFTLYSVSTVSGNTCYLRFNNSNTIFIGKATSSNRQVYFNDGSDHYLGSTIPESTDYTLTLTYEDGVATLTDGVNTLSLNIASLTSIYNVNVGRQDNYIKNIKIKTID